MVLNSSTVHALFNIRTSKGEYEAQFERDNATAQHLRQKIQDQKAEIQTLEQLLTVKTELASALKKQLKKAHNK